jgi:hypothetical protein
MEDNMIKNLQEKNPHIKIHHIDDSLFETYGRVLDSKPFRSAIDYLTNQTTVPTQGNEYIAHDKVMKSTIDNESVYNDVFGGLPVQYGYVNGHNQLLNAIEYHKSSEINIAASSFVILVGHHQDIEMLEYKANLLRAFYVPKDTVFELYSKTLHFSPFEVVNTGFKCGVILPLGTNVDFVNNTVLDTFEDQLLFKTNKWLLCHEECTKFIDLGAKGKILGSNIKINY